MKGQENIELSQEESSDSVLSVEEDLPSFVSCVFQDLNF